MSLKIGMIWAQGKNREIGRNLDMPWHIPEDLKHFKETTLGKPVIMGRKTWESLPENVRPLPGRDNFVITSNRTFEAPGAIIVHSLGEALASVKHIEDSSVDAWVMGGGALYSEAIHTAAILEVTEIEVDVSDADTYAPEIGPEFVKTFTGPDLISKGGLGYRFVTYRRQSS